MLLRRAHCFTQFASEQRRGLSARDAISQMPLRAKDVACVTVHIENKAHAEEACLQLRCR